MKRIYLSLFVIAICTFVTKAQDDADGCKDHALLSRMKGFFIETCAKSFDAGDFPTAATEAQTFEGNITTLRYANTTDIENNLPSELQIIRNYETAIVAKGGRKVYVGETEVGNGGKVGVFTIAANGVEHWIRVGDFYTPQGNGIGAFTVEVLEKEAMQQDVTANAISEALSKSGKIALQINFDTGKSTIKPESQPIVEQLAAALKADPNLKVSIEGHTDNVGNAALNKTLSEQRAQSVMKALVEKGIAAARMQAKGWGQEKPVADNGTDAGKAQNRRVEIVKM